jgi:uncharacterized protein YlxW (UPF0749 family)
MWDRCTLAAVVSHWRDLCQSSTNVKFEDRAKAQDSQIEARDSEIARLQDMAAKLQEELNLKNQRVKGHAAHIDALHTAHILRSALYSVFM